MAEDEVITDELYEAGAVSLLAALMEAFEDWQEANVDRHVTVTSVLSGASTFLAYLLATAPLDPSDPDGRQMIETLGRMLARLVPEMRANAQASEGET